MRHPHFPLRTTQGPTQQQAHELNAFLERLDQDLVTTSELLAVLITLREYHPEPALQEWCNGAAHKKRDRGDTFSTGLALWAERLQIDTFFAEDRPSFKKIPIPVFEMLIHVIGEHDFGVGGLGLKHLYPDGYSTNEIIQTLQFLYRCESESGYYELISLPEDSVQDVYLVEYVLPLLRQTLWGRKPIHFDEIHAGLVGAFTNLIGRGRRILQKKKDLLSLHFLCAFHQTEIDTGPRSLNPCYLTVDSTASKHLALSLAIYEKEKRGLEQMELSYERYRDPQLSASHDFARPYVVTDLTEQDHLYSNELHDFNWGIQGTSPLQVKKRDGRYRLILAK